MATHDRKDLSDHFANICPPLVSDLVGVYQVSHLDGSGVASWRPYLPATEPRVRWAAFQGCARLHLDRQGSMDGPRYKRTKAQTVGHESECHFGRLQGSRHGALIGNKATHPRN